MQNDSGYTHAPAAWGPGSLQDWPNRCFVPTASLPPRPGASLSGSVGPEGAVAATVGAAQAVSTAPSRSVVSLFASDNMEGAETRKLGPKSLRRNSQQVSSAPRPAVAEAAIPGSGGDTGSATSASDGTVQCPELPAMRNLSTSPMNSPLPQNSAVAASGSAAFLPDLCSTPQRQLTTPVAHAVPATAAAVECSEVAEAGLASKAQPDSGGAGEACEMEDAKPSGSWRIEPEVLKQEAMQGLASKNPHLPQPVRVTVGPNAFRQQQQQIHNHQQSSLQSQQQQQNAIPQAAKKRGRDAGGASHRQWGSADGDDSDGQKKRGGSSRGAAGRGARRDADDIEDKPPVFGMFYPDRYMVGVDCILVDGMFVSRSRFEKLGGSLMAKWYRSIRVVDTAEPLGAWLERHNLPVFTGKARQRRQRGAPSTNASAAAAMAAASAAAAANTNNTLAGDTDKNRGSSNNLGLDVDAGTSACGTDGAWPACLDVKAEPERFSAMGAGLAVGEALTPGHGGSGGSGSDEGLAADLSVTQRSRPGFPADKMSRLEGTLGVDNADYWQGMRPLMLGQRSMMIGIHLSDTEALKVGFNAASLQQPLHASTGNSATASEQSPRATATADDSAIGFVGSSSAGVAYAAGGSNSGAIAGRLSAGVSATRGTCAGLETLPNGAVAPGVYLIGGRMAPGDHATQQPAEQQHYHMLSQRLQPSLSQQLTQQQLQQPQPDQQQKLQQHQHQQFQQQQGYLPQRQQQGFQQPPFVGGRYLGPGDSCAPLPAQDLAPNSVYGPTPQLSNLSHTALAARDSLAWGPGSLPAGDCAYDGAACPPTGLSIRRFGSDGDAGLAAGAHTLGCAGPSKLAAEATVMRAPAAVGKVAGGGCYGDVSAVAGCTEAGELSLAPASSCRLPESTSLESAPTTSSSRWTSSNFVLSPGAGGLMQYNSIDPVNEDGGPAGRHDWDSDSWAYPCGPLPPDMSAPAQVPTPAQYGQYELQQQQQQLHKQLYPAMSRQQMHDPQLGAPPTVWPQSRTKPQQEEINRTAQSPFVQVQQQGTEQQSLQGDSSSFSVSGGARAQSQLQPAQGGVSVATAMAPPFPEAIDPGLPSLVSPPVLVPAATAEATDSPAQLTPQKSGHMYPPSSRHWPPYSNHYWPCHPYPPGHTRSVPGMPPRLPVGPGGPVRPYQRNVYPREMTPPAPAPSPAPFTPPYGCYYSHPYPRRGLPPTTYRRRYAAPGPGTVDVPPGVYGARYEAAALSGPYVPGRPEVEAPMDGAAAGSMLHPTTSACLDDVGLSVAGTSACMPAAPSVSRAPPGGAVAGGDSTCGTAAGAASGRMSSGGAVMPQTELQPPSLPLQQQHRGIATAASMTTAYPYSWASTPQHVARPFPTNSRNQHPQHMHEGGFAADMGMGLTSSSAAASYRPQVPHRQLQATGASSSTTGAGPALGPPAGGGAFNSLPTASSALAAASAAAGSGLFVPPPTGSAATAASVSGAAGVFPALCGADGDVDPMWAHFQCWSAEEATRAPQYM